MRVTESFLCLFLFTSSSGTRVRDLRLAGSLLRPCLEAGNHVGQENENLLLAPHAITFFPHVVLDTSPISRCFFVHFARIRFPGLAHDFEVPGGLQYVFNLLPAGIGTGFPFGDPPALRLRSIAVQVCGINGVPSAAACCFGHGTECVYTVRGERMMSTCGSAGRDREGGTVSASRVTTRDRHLHVLVQEDGSFFLSKMCNPGIDRRTCPRTLGIHHGWESSLRQ